MRYNFNRKGQEIPQYAVFRLTNLHLISVFNVYGCVAKLALPGLCNGWLPVALMQYLPKVMSAPAWCLCINKAVIARLILRFVLINNGGPVGDARLDLSPRPAVVAALRSRFLILLLLNATATVMSPLVLRWVIRFFFFLSLYIMCSLFCNLYILMHFMNEDMQMCLCLCLCVLICMQVCTGLCLTACVCVGMRIEKK